MRPIYRRRYIVNEQHILQIPVNHPQVLHIEALFTPPATISEKPMRNQSPWIEIVDDDIGVALVAGSKDDQLKLP